MGANARRSLAALLRNYNLAAVARELQVDPSTVYRWRDGRVKPSGERLQSLARFLRIDANDILLDDEEDAAHAS
jgi:transcriptional regulator with XRE-family HTH domain